MSDIQALITEHLAIWTGADNEKRSGRGRASGSAASVYGVKKLRELILELAVRGKLVPQDVSDEPASELLKRIAAEKAKLIKEGKIKAQKPLAEIGDDEKPFELPKGWIFSRFGDVMINRDGERIPVSSDERSLRKGEFDYYGASGVIDKIDKFLFDKPLLLIGEDGANLINRSTPIAFIARGKYWVNNHAHVLDGISEEFLRYIELFINAINLEAYVTGTAQPKMNQAKMNSIVVAVAPEKEQHRIVAKVDGLMTLCDQLENQHSNAIVAHEKLVSYLLNTLTQSQDAAEFNESWQRIAANFDTLFSTESSIDALKQTVLQLAVMGKLVPQDVNDEPASELLKRIQSEKAKLITEGKIKKDKPFAVITDDEKPFELPLGWEWMRLGSVSVVLSGNAFRSEDFNTDSGVRVIKITNAGVGEIIETDDFLPSEFSEIYSSYLVSKDDLILALTRPYIADGLKISKCPVSYHHSLLNQRVASIRFDECIYNDYGFLFLRSKFVLDLYQGRFSGSGLQPNLKISDVTELVLSIPPLAEQHRIVAKVDELMAICNQLKTRITTANQLQQKLADVLVAQAVA